MCVKRLRISLQCAAGIEDGAETKIVCSVTEITDGLWLVIDNMANYAI
jgi:hypothetical protein